MPKEPIKGGGVSAALRSRGVAVEVAKKEVHRSKDHVHRKIVGINPGPEGEARVQKGEGSSHQGRMGFSKLANRIMPKKYILSRKKGELAEFLNWQKKESPGKRGQGKAKKGG